MLYHKKTMEYFFKSRTITGTSLKKNEIKNLGLKSTTIINIAYCKKNPLICEK